MKPYVLITLLTCLFVGSACRVNREVSSSYQSTEQRDSVVEKSTSKLELSSNNYLQEKKTTEDVFDEITTVAFDPVSGAISSIQTAKRTTRRNELQNSSGRSDDVSITQSKDSTVFHQAENTAAETNKKETSDNRPVQGFSEWLGVAIGAAAFLVIVFGFIIYKFKKK